MSTLQQPAPGTLRDGGAQSGLDPNDPVIAERLIKPSRGWIAIDWAEIIHSRDLFNTLIMRDIRVRYKQTVLGVGWAIIQPLAGMIVFTLVFSNFPGVKPEGIAYPLFLLAGMIPWTFFMNSVTGAGTSLLAQQQLVTKIYFPRIYIPASTVGTYLVDMAVGLVIFAFLMPYYRFYPSWNIVYLPFVILLTFAAAFGLGLIFASVTVLYRDLRFVIPYLMSLLMYASPIFYQPSALPPQVQLLIAANPVTGIINAYRWSILGLPLDVPALLISCFVTLAVLIFGLYFFRRTERFVADLI